MRLDKHYSNLPNTLFHPPDNTIPIFPTPCFTPPSPQDKTKEFTQLVWKETDRVGCGYSKREPLFYIVVCEYTPTGNEGSRSVYHDNVNKKMSKFLDREGAMGAG